MHTIKTIRTEKYEVNGVMYDNKQAAEKALADLQRYTDNPAAKYLETSYSGQDLLKKHSLDEQGLWHVMGEDPNADFGGAHRNPTIGFVNGSLFAAVNWAVKQKDFYTWGAGGILVKVDVIDLTTKSKKRV